MTTTPEPLSSSEQKPNLQPEAQPNGNHRPTTSLHWGMLVFALTVISLAVILQAPNQKQITLPLIGTPLPELCNLRRWFGFDCPGCGLTRCFVSMAHGRIDRAWQFNPAGVLLFVMFAIQIPFRTIQIWRIRHGLTELRSAIGNWLIWSFAALLLVQWIFKMFSYFL